jgi:hypothetical protein
MLLEGLTSALSCFARTGALSASSSVTSEFASFPLAVRVFPLGLP